MKKVLLSILFVLQSFFMFSQQNTGITAKIVDSKTKKPLQNVVASIQNTNLTILTDVNGKFTFKGVPSGNKLLQIRYNGYKDQLFPVEIVAGQILDLGLVLLEEDQVSIEQQSNLITITENDLSDENSGSESTSGLLQASRDVFLQAAAYNWGQARFSPRGIDNEYSTVMINGTIMNRIADGRPQYGDWGGLNDVTRNQEFTNGSAPSDYIFGGVAGTQEINTRASIYRPGTRLSFLNTNTNYSYRVMATYASGMNKDGWAFAISGGRRWAQEGYFEGTNYAANSLFASVEKKFNEKHTLNFTSIYAQNKRGKNSPNTDEVTELVGEKYNSYWGYQAGKKRNSRFKDSEEPLMMLTHYWKITPKTNLNTTLSYQTGRIGNSRFDYTKSNNPDPIYYKKLPSYYTSLYTGDSFTPNLPAAEITKNKFIANPQVDWNNIYRINKENIANGSRIYLYEDRNDEDILMANMNLNSHISDNLLFFAGANYMDSKTKNFKNLLDLLGGNYVTDVTTFGFGPSEQSDLNNINRTVVVGDKYGYNYDVNATRLDVFTQFKFTYDKADFYLAQSYSKSVYQRDGLYKNGYFPTNSFGKSEKMEFENFGFKGGMTYKISGRHFLDFNGIYMTKAPSTKDVFSNARVNNTTTEGITNEKITAIDASYVIRTPKFKARFTGYLNETLNSTDISFYYNDAKNLFLNEIVKGINKKNRGVEAGIEYQISPTIKLSGAVSYGEFTFTNDPLIALKSDNGEINTAYQPSSLKGYRQAGTPQQAYSFGIEYRNPKFWWIGANANYLTDNYLDVAANTRTTSFRVPINATTPIDEDLANSYLAQEKLNPIQLLNFTGGKSWRIKETTIGLFVSVNNALNFKYKTGGFEQSRSTTYKDIYEDRSGGGVGSFGPRYFNGYGRTYVVNVYLTF